MGIGIRQVRQHVQALCNASYIDKLLDVVQSAPNEPGGAGKYPIFPPASLSACVKMNRH